MLKTNICGVEFQNPLMLAAGIMGSNASSMNWILKSGAAGVITKSFSLKPHPGYKNPTTVAVDGGIINAIGLSNPGVDNFKEEIKQKIARKNAGRSLSEKSGNWDFQAFFISSLAQKENMR